MDFKLGEGRFNIVVDIVNFGLLHQDQKWQIDVGHCLKGFISGVKEEKFVCDFIYLQYSGSCY